MKKRIKHLHFKFSEQLLIFDFTQFTTVGAFSNYFFKEKLMGCADAYSTHRKFTILKSRRLFISNRH